MGGGDGVALGWDVIRGWAKGAGGGSLHFSSSISKKKRQTGGLRLVGGAGQGGVALGHVPPFRLKVWDGSQGLPKLAMPPPQWGAFVLWSCGGTSPPGLVLAYGNGSLWPQEVAKANDMASETPSRGLWRLWAAVL